MSYCRLYIGTRVTRFFFSSWNLLINRAEDFKLRPNRYKVMSQLFGRWNCGYSLIKASVRLSLQYLYMNSLMLGVY